VDWKEFKKAVKGHYLESETGIFVFCGEGEAVKTERWRVGKKFVVLTHGEEGCDEICKVVREYVERAGGERVE